MEPNIFYKHGYFCASHPWEVIFAFLSVSVSLLLCGTTFTGKVKLCAWNYHCIVTEENKSIDIILMTAARCVAVLYIYYQLKKIYNLGSKYLLGIALLFTILSITVFATIFVNLMEGHLTELKEALPLFLLLLDLSKAGLLAKFALSSANQEEVKKNIANGMAVIGPTVTLDTIVETLVIGIGMLSGVKKLEDLCCFACMTAVGNYFVFMTFFPACISVMLQIWKMKISRAPVLSEQLSSLAKGLQHEEYHKPNPVLQKVKVIMSVGLVLVHVHSLWTLSANDEGRKNYTSNGDFISDVPFAAFLDRWFFIKPEQVVMMTLATALVIKYIFFNNEELVEKAYQYPSEKILNCKKIPTLIVTDAGKEQSLDSLPEKKDSSPEPSSPSSVSSERQAIFTVGEDSDWEGADYKQVTHKEVQTNDIDELESLESMKQAKDIQRELRSIEECLCILNSEDGCYLLTDEEVLLLIKQKHIPPYNLESILGNPERGVAIRRKLIANAANCSDVFNGLPYSKYDYSMVMGACCENVVGYMPIPVGVAGPLMLDGSNYFVPMATTEGCLVASTNRGCRALAMAGGVRSSVVADGMTRGPVVRLPSAQEAAEVMIWLQENFEILKTAFDSSSRFARLQRIQTRIAGRYLFIRFVSSTGDAMGMNMLSKGTEISLNKLQDIFPNLEVLSLSGNYCTDKKPAAVNWIEGRGKSVVCESVIPAKIVKEVLKTNVHSIIDVNIAKNLVGSAIAGSIGGFNAQAANIVTAIFIATGQDPAQNIGSSNCMTLMEPYGEDGEALYISCTMPSIEVGTIGGGTVLTPQAACLELLGVRGCSTEKAGKNATTLARIVCGTVMAAELSLLSALAAGHLVRSHMKHNRSNISISACVNNIPPCQNGGYLSTNDSGRTEKKT